MKEKGIEKDSLALGLNTRKIGGSNLRKKMMIFSFLFFNLTGIDGFEMENGDASVDRGTEVDR